MRKGWLIAAAIVLLLILFSDVWAFKHSHIRTAALTYSLTDDIGADFVGRHYDMAINPGGQRYTIIKNADPNILCLRYATISSFRDSDYQSLQDFCNQYGYNYDSMFLWTSSSTNCIDAVAPAGPPCSGNSTCTSGGEKLEYCGWNSFRTAPDFRRPALWHYVVNKYLTSMGDDYDGIMEDECVNYYHPQWDIPSVAMAFPLSSSKWAQGSAANVNGWAGMSHTAIRDSLLYLKQQEWLPMLMDSLRAHDKLRYANPAAYGVTGSDVIDDVILTGTGVLAGEGMHLSPILGASFFNGEAWNIMDEVAGSEGSAIMWCEINASESLSLGSWARCQMERLAWYYMKADTGHFYFLPTGNSPEIRANDYRAGDSLYKWCPAFEHDTGQPLGAMYTAQSGNDPAGQAYTLYARNFENAVVFYRGARGSNYDNSTAVTYNLGGQYQQLYSDGTLGGVTSTASIRNCEGIILLKGSGTPRPKLSIRTEIDTIAVDYTGCMVNSGDETMVVDLDIDFAAGDTVLTDIGLDRYGIHISPGDTLYMPYWGAVANPTAGDYILIARAIDSETGEMIDSCSFTVSIRE